MQLWCKLSLSCAKSFNFDDPAQNLCWYTMAVVRQVSVRLLLCLEPPQSLHCGYLGAYQAAQLQLHADFCSAGTATQNAYLYQTVPAEHALLKQSLIMLLSV